MVAARSHRWGAGGDHAEEARDRALSAALLLSGLWVGVSYGGNGGIVEPQVIELNTGHCGEPHTRCRFYGLRTRERSTARSSPCKDRAPMSTVAVGRFRETCTYVGGTSNVCTQVFTLKPGPHTERGSIVTTGVLGEWVEG